MLWFWKHRCLQSLVLCGSSSSLTPQVGMGGAGPRNEQPSGPAATLQLPIHAPRPAWVPGRCCPRCVNAHHTGTWGRCQHGTQGGVPVEQPVWGTPVTQEWTESPPGQDHEHRPSWVACGIGGVGLASEICSARVPIQCPAARVQCLPATVV